MLTKNENKGSHFYLLSKILWESELALEIHIVKDHQSKTYKQHSLWEFCSVVHLPNLKL